MRLFIGLVLCATLVTGRYLLTGPLQGLTCDSEDVQEANSEQLYGILAELCDTTFFRLVRVDDESPGYCSIDAVRATLTTSAGTCGGDSSAGLPSIAAGPTSSFYSAFMDPGPSLPLPGASEGEHAGGLCGVESESTPQSYSETVVKKISAEEKSAQLEFPRDNECVIEGTFQIRPDYWLDICDDEFSDARGDFVNLQLNPERNTGYNGSLVWEEMHRQVGLLQSTEGRVLQKLLSGYHTSVSTQVMNSYFPPKASEKHTSGNGHSKNGKWKSNAKKFAEQLFLPHPQRFQDMQFAFVVVSRSLFRIRDFLSSYSFSTGNTTADASTQRLVRHLLDSSLLSTCGSVVTAFDESQLFAHTADARRSAVATEFKKTFRRLSRLVNCVSCKRCKLHAAVAMHGFGVALKILLTDPLLVTERLSRDDIVALFNTVHKLSESVKLANDLMSEYYATVATAAESVKAAALPIAQQSPTPLRWSAEDDKLIDKLLSAVAQHAASLSTVERDAIVHAALNADPQLLKVAQHFDGLQLARHALIRLGVQLPDAVVVGGGLAGLVTAISLADRNASVLLLDKSSALGGNSARASSGINTAAAWMQGDDDQSSNVAYSPGGPAAPRAHFDVEHEPLSSDELSFLQDTLKSQNKQGDQHLANVLVHRANASVEWLQRVANVSLSSVGQLGGHRLPRTMKPLLGLVGAELMTAMLREVKARAPLITVRTHATVTQILSEVRDNRSVVTGVEYTDANHNTSQVVYARNVVLASGGFGFDRDGLLKEHRPDLVDFPTTLGTHTTGDGIRLAASLGAALTDMQYVQLHPTGFVDPKDRDNRVKVLAAEVLRGVGGVLLTRSGQRFVNELGTRKAVTDQMLRFPKGQDREFFLVLTASGAAEAARLIQIYVSRGLLVNVTTAEGLQGLIGETGMASLREYSTANEDAFGRQDRRGLPFHCNQTFWLVGEVTPVVHYTMGGVKIDDQGRVMSGARQGDRPSTDVIPHLFAVGEVSGGVHGENRLGGNSLLECTVFGRIIGGEAIEVNEDLGMSHFPRRKYVNSVDALGDSAFAFTESKAAPPKSRTLSMEEVRGHSSVGDCWTVIDGSVYDLSQYATDHPGGVSPIVDSCGTDSTARFMVAHTIGLLADADFVPIGKLDRHQ